MADKKEFVRKLAQYLAGDQAHKSILLEMQRPEAKEWAALRGTTPLFGYPTVEDAEKELAAWLGISLEEEKKPVSDACPGRSAGTPSYECEQKTGHLGRHCITIEGHKYEWGIDYKGCKYPGKELCKGKPLKGLTMCRKHQPFPART